MERNQKKVKMDLNIKMREQLLSQLNNKYIELEEKNRIMDSHLKMARSLQRSLIPDIDTDYNGIGFSSRSLTAMDIGGDFHYISPLDEERVCFVMGDVSGHGIPAALLTSMLLTMLQNLLIRYHNPARVLYRLNQEFFKALKENEIDIYACVFLGIINVPKQRIYYSNAGMGYPIYVSDHRVRELEASGLPIGMMSDARYDYYTLKYKKEDLLMLYTDGLQSGFFKSKPEEFADSLKELIVKSSDLDNLNDIIDIILNVFYDYKIANSRKAELDDVSVLLCRL